MLLILVTSSTFALHQKYASGKRTHLMKSSFSSSHTGSELRLIMDKYSSMKKRLPSLRTKEEAHSCIKGRKAPDTSSSKIIPL